MSKEFNPSRRRAIKYSAAIFGSAMLANGIGLWSLSASRLIENSDTIQEQVLNTMARTAITSGQANIEPGKDQEVLNKLMERKK